MHLSDLQANQCAMTVLSYSEDADTFQVHIADASPSQGQDTTVPRILMPKLTGEVGEPESYVCRVFIITA